MIACLNMTLIESSLIHSVTLLSKLLKWVQWTQETEEEHLVILRFTFTFCHLANAFVQPDFSFRNSTCNTYARNAYQNENQNQFYCQVIIIIILKRSSIHFRVFSCCLNATSDSAVCVRLDLFLFHMKSPSAKSMDILIDAIMNIGVYLQKHKRDKNSVQVSI